jgi:hypothetical protein
MWHDGWQENSGNPLRATLNGHCGASIFLFSMGFSESDLRIHSRIRTVVCSVHPDRPGEFAPVDGALMACQRDV